MSKTITRLLAVAMCVVMMLTAAPLGGFAGLNLPGLFDIQAEAEENISGVKRSGDGWTIYNDGELVITKNLTFSANYYDNSFDQHYLYKWPWCSAAYYTDGDYSWAGEGINFYGITKVTIKEGVTAIGNFLFAGQHDIKSITIPSTVTSIGAGAFYRCTSLETINMDSPFFSLNTYDPIGPAYGGMFQECSSLKEIVISNKVASIGDSCFSGCTFLENVMFEEGTNITSIGSSAFNSCSLLKKIVVPGNYTEIKSYTFRDCTSLKYVLLSSTVISLGEGCFKNCTSVEEINVPPTLNSIGPSAFSGCESLITLELPDSLQTINKNAFLSSGIRYIEIPSGVTTILNTVFSNCLNLETVIINEGITTISTDAFKQCARLKYIAIPSTLTTIAQNSFTDCVSIGLVIYPGAEDYWNQIDVVTTGNEYFIAANRYYSHWHGEHTQFYLRDFVQVSCESSGYTGDKCCADCGWVFEMGKHQDALGHNFSQTVIDATCVSNGFKYTVCLNCKQSTIDEIYAATGHSYKSKVTKPTCTDGGYTLNVCSKCGLSTITDETEALGHDYEETVIESTCTRDGYTVHKCKRCNSSYIDGENPAFGHSYVDTEVKSTCTGVGYTSHKCSTCGDEYVTNEIPAKGHSYEPIVIAADCVNAGYTIFICADCGIAYKGDEIPAKGHSYKDTVIKPTCTEGGHTVHECAVCGETYIDSYTEKLDHNYGETVVAPTCENEGYTRHECSNCHDCYDTNVVPATGHEMKSAVVEATCTSDGFTVSSCTKCGYSSITNETKAYGHNYQKAVEIKHTCIQDGCTLNICANCNGVSKTDGTPATGHSFGEWGVVNEASENTEGLQTRTCKNCGYTEEKIISMIQRTTFNVTFKAEGETVAVVEYLKGATEIEEPPVPHKARHNGRWSDYTLNDSDITVEAIYEVVDMDTLEGIDYGKSSVYNPDTGVATINVYAASSGKTVISTTTTQTPLDIILVVDQSGSMDFKLGGSKTKKQALVDSANEFVNAIYVDAYENNVEHRVAIVGFGMGNQSSGFQYPAFLNTEILTTGGNPIQFNKASAEDYANALMDVNVEGEINADIVKAINAIDANGATAADYGLSMANSIFANNSDASGRERIVVFMTDGAPTYSSDFSVDVANSAILQSNELKNTYGASVYSIGVMSNDDINQQNVGRFMEYVSSNYGNAQNINKKYTAVSDKYYMHVNNTNALNDIFTGIVTENITRTTDFDNITIIDTVSEYFTLTSQQEKALRINLIETFGIRNSDIVVERKSDGTTAITVKNLSPIDNGEKFVVDFSFEVSANQKAANAGVYPTNTSDSGILIDGAENYECVFTVPNITVPADRKVAVFRINGEIYEIITYFSNNITAPKTDFIGDYQFTGWDLKSDDLSDGYAEYDSTYVTQSYVVIWNIDGEKKTVEYVPGQVIDEPIVFPDDNGNAFRRWNGKVPITMPASSIEFTAVYGDHEHTYVTETVTQVTCTMDGMIKHTCSICADSYSENVKCIGEHSWKAIAGSSADETSYETFECEYCGEHNGYSLEYTEKENNGNAYGHVNKKQKVNDFNYVDGDGNKAQPDGDINITSTVYDDFADAEDVYVYRVNENGENVLCDSEYENGVVSFETNHFSTYIFVPVYKCTTTGNHTDSESDNYCDVCGSQIEKEVSVNWYVDGTIVKTDIYRKGDLINAPEDPTKDGADFVGWNPYVPTCADDDDLHFVAMWSVEEHEHSSVTIGAYTPTYTQPGYTGDKYCSICGDLLESGEKISATLVYANGTTVIDSESNTIYGLSAGVNSIDGHLTVADDKYSISCQSVESGLGTGSKVVVNNGEAVIAKYTVIIFGDIDGNGWYDANDAFIVNMIASGLIPADRLSAAQLRAADCNHDGKVDSADFYLLNQASLMLEDVDQSATGDEFSTNAMYISYCSLIDQSAGKETNLVPAPEATPETTPEISETEEFFDIEVFFSSILDFIKKIFTIIFSF